MPIDPNDPGIGAVDSGELPPDPTPGNTPDPTEFPGEEIDPDWPNPDWPNAAEVV